MATSKHPNLRPVLDLVSASPGITVRASTDRNCVYLSCVHAESNVCVSIVAAYAQQVRLAAVHNLQVGQTVFLLAQGEAARFFAWLAIERAAPSEVH